MSPARAVPVMNFGICSKVDDLEYQQTPTLFIFDPVVEKNWVWNLNKKRGSAYNLA
jgi:hypothetical protein